ncbi:type 1 glutamine amidotransferase domain-containing protein [Corynebacterium sp. H127]|uniref:type 1 glutamine amidotransferase domain-containing protein n=1 Tax=Corynebacterium sp. H127 TaxID=3133418 RepID=UPI0030B25670
MANVLMVVSAADHWTLADGSTYPTGFWAEELLTPYECFQKAGMEITFATPGGKAPTVDETSLSIKGGVLPPAAAKFKEKLAELEPQLSNPRDLADIDPDAFDLIFYPGGHGPMEDLAYDKTSGELLSQRLASGRPLALLCHAPAALLATIDEATGQTPFANKNVTAFSNAEEIINPAAKKAKWLLEDRLKAAGMNYQKALLPMRPKVVQDGNLFTGQNPQSSQELAELLIAELT